MNNDAIEANAQDFIDRLDEDPRHAIGSPMSLEDAVIHALETGERFGLAEPVRAIVSAVVAEPKARHGANVCDVTIGPLDLERVAVIVQLFDGSVVPLVVAVAAH